MGLLVAETYQTTSHGRDKNREASCLPQFIRDKQLRWQYQFHIIRWAGLPFPFQGPANCFSCCIGQFRVPECELPASPQPSTFARLFWTRWQFVLRSGLYRALSSSSRQSHTRFKSQKVASNGYQQLTTWPWDAHFWSGGLWLTYTVGVWFSSLDRPVWPWWRWYRHLYQRQLPFALSRHYKGYLQRRPGRRQLGSCQSLSPVDEDEIMRLLPIQRPLVLDQW